MNTIIKIISVYCVFQIISIYDVMSLYKWFILFTVFGCTLIMRGEEVGQH